MHLDFPKAKILVAQKDLRFLGYCPSPDSKEESVEQLALALVLFEEVVQVQHLAVEVAAAVAAAPVLLVVLVAVPEVLALLAVLLAVELLLG